MTDLITRIEAAKEPRRTTCGDCVKLAECTWEFGAQPDDPVCTGFREPLRAERKNDEL